MRLYPGHNANVHITFMNNVMEFGDLTPLQIDTDGDIDINQRLTMYSNKETRIEITDNIYQKIITTTLTHFIIHEVIHTYNKDVYFIEVKIKKE